MAKIHDLFIVELAEVIKGYGNNPDDADPFKLSEFYRFYELPNIAISRENFEKMRPVEPERKTGRWITSDDLYETGICSCCKQDSQEPVSYAVTNFNYCPNCGADMREQGTVESTVGQVNHGTIVNEQAERREE